MIHEDHDIVTRIRDWRPHRPSTPPLVLDVPRGQGRRALSRRRIRAALRWAALVSVASALGAFAAAHGLWWW